MPSYFRPNVDVYAPIMIISGGVHYLGFCVINKNGGMTIIANGKLGSSFLASGLCGVCKCSLSYSLI